MRSSRIVMASDSQCWSRNCPGFYLSILWHSLTWGAPDEAVFNKVRREKNRPLHVWWCSLLNCEWKDGAGMRWWEWEWPPPLCRPRVLSVDTGWATHQLFSSPSWTLQVRLMNTRMKMPKFRIRIQIRSWLDPNPQLKCGSVTSDAKWRKRVNWMLSLEGSMRLQESLMFFRSSK